ncbi:MAG: DNA recombination protein RmuC [Gemmatimonadota bacterium]|nr:DNA recombination protein RmuC [Gemmatimonadota bacterium]
MPTLAIFALAVTLLVIGAALGWLATFALQRQTSAGLTNRIADLTARFELRSAEAARLLLRIDELGAADVKCAALSAQLDAERRSSADRIAVMEQAELRMREAFQSMGAEALRQNSESFLQLAKTSLTELQQSTASDLEQRQQAITALVSPLKETLEKMDGTIKQVEIARVGSYESLVEQVRSMGDAQKELTARTRQLGDALRAPTVRGRWGEIQLKRVCEMAGMLDHCDFTEQTTVNGADGKLRPDLTVRLPGGKVIIVDAKAPLLSYLAAVDCSDEVERERLMRDHSRQVRDHMVKLGQKTYWGQFDSTPEFVVMFLPGETFFSAALQYDPGLIEYGVDQKVIPSSPTTLIALLRSIAYGWQQDRVARNAEEISALGKEMYTRISVFAGHFDSLRRGLEKSVESYNSAVGSLERKVMPQARKFRELGGFSAPDIPAIESVDLAMRRRDIPEDSGDVALPPAATHITDPAPVIALPTTYAERAPQRSQLPV